MPMFDLVSPTPLRQRNMNESHSVHSGSPRWFSFAEIPLYRPTPSSGIDPFSSPQSVLRTPAEWPSARMCKPGE